MNEIWKDIQGYEGLYQVSNLGRVKSLRRDKILAPKKNWDGYLRIQLWRNNKNVFVSIHRLVAQAFIDNLENKPFINHKDGDKQNNYVENLEWCTQKENIYHAQKMGLSKTNGCKKVLCVELNKIFNSASEASRWLGFTGNVVHKAARKCKKSGGYTWRYI